MLTTHTGSFPIGIRRGWSDWQKDLDGLIAWAKQNGLGVIDLGQNADVDGRKVADAGLKVGSADLREWKGVISADEGKRRAAVQANAGYIADCAKMGIKNFFAVMLPENPTRTT